MSIDDIMDCNTAGCGKLLRALSTTSMKKFWKEHG